jgi:tetratricopeptide (TPR) repeat protein
MQANAEPMETPGARQLTAHHPVTMRAPVYSLAEFRPEELLSCVHPVPTNVWAEVTYSMGPDFLGPIGRHRLTWYDDLDVRVHKDQSASDADPDWVLTAAIISANRGDYDTAVEVLTRAINNTKIQTADGVGWFYIGYRIAFLDKAGRFDEAIVDYRQMLTIRPSDTGALAGLAQELYKVERSAEALPFADQAVAQAPNDLNLNLRAKINEQLGRRSEAITDYRAAMRAGMNESETKTAREALVRLGEVP